MTPTITALSRQDWLAAHVGMQDARSIGCRAPAPIASERGRLGRLWVWLVGENAPAPLADPRLEAVRRFACATHAGVGADAGLLGELHQRGLADAQLDAIARFAA